jgi:hypothetical protein
VIILENYYQIITVVIGCVAFLSPIAVSLINNLHNSKMRVKEMAHERELKRIELHHELEVKQLDVYYKEKKEAFEQFLITAGRLLYNVGSTKGIPDLHAVAAAALLYCSEENKARILEFLKYATTDVERLHDIPIDERVEFSEIITELSYHLNEELKSTANNSK